MVYCGKPSRGCHACRKRKIRCDQDPDGCGQCVKANRPCPGYRDQLELTFRNETTKVTKKAKARVQAKADAASQLATAVASDLVSSSDELSYSRPSSPAKSTSQNPSFPSDDQSPLSLVRTLSLNPEELATGFFLRNYAVGHEVSSFKFDNSVLNAVKALGLAGFANVHKAPHLKYESQRFYLDAIQSTNRALQDPKIAVQDNTLLSIIILGVYEIVVGRGPRSLDTWSNHVKGAAALLKMRGPGQMRTISGRRMFHQVVISLITSSLNYDFDLPEYIFTLREFGLPYTAPTDPTWRWMGLMLHIVNFRSRLMRGELTDLEDILTTACIFDEEIYNIFNIDLPQQWNFWIIRSSEDPDLIPCGFFHVYQNFLTSHAWNGVRTIRIMLNEIISNVLIAGMALNPPIFEGEKYRIMLDRCERVQRSIGAEIVASVPQNLGYLEKIGLRLDSLQLAPGVVQESPVSVPDDQSCVDSRANFKNISSTPTADVSSDHTTSSTKLSSGFKYDLPTPSYSESTASPSETEEPNENANTAWSAFRPQHFHSIVNNHMPVIQTTKGYALLWPVYLVTVMDTTDGELRKNTIELLKQMGRKMGINQALVLSENAEQWAIRMIGPNWRNDGNARPRKPPLWVGNMCRNAGIGDRMNWAAWDRSEFFELVQEVP